MADFSELNPDVSLKHTVPAWKHRYLHIMRSQMHVIRESSHHGYVFVSDLRLVSFLFSAAEQGIKAGHQEGREGDGDGAGSHRGGGYLRQAAMGHHRRRPEEPPRVRHYGAPPFLIPPPLPHPSATSILLTTAKLLWASNDGGHKTATCPPLRTTPLFPAPRLHLFLCSAPR